MWLSGGQLCGSNFSFRLHVRIRFFFSWEITRRHHINCHVQLIVSLQICWLITVIFVKRIVYWFIDQWISFSVVIQSHCLERVFSFFPNTSWESIIFPDPLPTTLQPPSVYGPTWNWTLWFPCRHCTFFFSLSFSLFFFSIPFFPLHWVRRLSCLDTSGSWV